MKEFSENLSNIPNLLHLNLNNNKIESEGIKYLSNSFELIPHLKTLYLQSNEIGSSGIEILCDNLYPLTELEYLDLFRIYIYNIYL